MPLYDFRCDEGHEFEERGGFNTSEVPCHCGLVARRSSVNRIGVSGFATPAMNERPLPISRGQEAMDDMQTQARKTGVEAPDVWQIAKDEAKRIRQHEPELIKGN